MSFFRNVLQELVQGIQRFTGTISWQPPLWLQHLKQRQSEFLQNKPRSIFWSVLILSVVAVVGLGYGTWNFLENRGPFLTASATPPGPGVWNENKIQPQPLLIDFPQSVAPLSKIGQKIPHGISIQPEVIGTWNWTSDRLLRFDPEKEWPAGVEYRVKVRKNALAENTPLPKPIPFHSTPFTAKLEQFELYMDPEQPKIKNLVASISFSHEVSDQELLKHIELVIKKADSIFEKKTEEKKFWSIEWDPSHRKAFLKSAQLSLPSEIAFATLKILKGIRPISGSPSKDSIEREISIPDFAHFLKIKNVESVVANNPKGEPQGSLLFEFTGRIKREDLNKKVSVYLLPEKKPSKTNSEAAGWTSAGEVTSDVLKKSQKMNISFAETELPYSERHSAFINTPENRYLYIVVDAGLKSLGDFSLNNSYQTVIPTPEFAKEVHFLGNGSVLSLKGEKKITVMTRSIANLEYRIGKISDSQIHHLISQTAGNFQSPYFKNYLFNEENLCEILSESCTLNKNSHGKANYSTVDLSRYLKDSHGDRCGLFLLEAKEKQEHSQKNSSTNSEDNVALDRRFILISDLGLLTKENISGSRDVYVASIESGKPVEGVQIHVLAKNGSVIVSSKTDASGHATLESFKSFEKENKPVAILAQKGSDLAFLPVGRADRRLNLSRYETGGFEATSLDQLRAFLFSDRGLYRPGEKIHIGIALKSLDWKNNLPPFPVWIRVSDPEDKIQKEELIHLGKSLFCEWDFSTLETAQTGTYHIQLFFKQPDDKETILGDTSIRVEEFFPDTLKIKTAFKGTQHKGWIFPENLSLEVDLQNLFGAPAFDHRLEGDFQCSPIGFVFNNYPDYHFFDPNFKTHAEQNLLQETLPSIQTNEKGFASWKMPTEKFDRAAFNLIYVARGFEKESGRNVSTSGEVKISSLLWVIGYKTDGDLAYLPRDTKREVTWIAINPDLEKCSLKDLSLILSEEHPVSILTKKENGTYAYESVVKEKELSRQMITITEKGYQWTVPTNTPGNYIARILDAEGHLVSTVSFSVVGESNNALGIERDAELQAKLSKPEYKKGEEIEVAVTAPYTGTGLITIESDRVYAHQWFKTNSKSSIQKIKLPSNIEGNAYLCVSMVRGIDSEEIYRSPLSFTVLPFRVNRDERTIQIELKTPSKAVPGKDLQIEYNTSRPCKLILYGIDEGILQAASYKLPEPVEYFLEKKALQVTTDQIVDLLLPEYSIIKKVAAIGGDGGDELLAANLNPFKRKDELPVVFWSGIIDSNQKKYSFKVPEYFNGTLRVMAVAVSDEAAGQAESKIVCHGPLVIQSYIPPFAAPGDEIMVNTTFTNLLQGPGEDVIKLFLEIPQGFDVLDVIPKEIKIARQKDAVVKFRIKAKDLLGNATFNWKAEIENQTVTRSTSCSIRPLSLYRHSVTSGIHTESQKNFSLYQSFYPELLRRELSLSPYPMALVKGLFTELDQYPHLCSEQLSSRGLSYLTAGMDSRFGGDPVHAKEEIEKIIRILHSRQNDQGAFGFWETEADASDDFISVYAMHFIIEAKERKMAIPREMFESGITHLETIAQGELATGYDLITKSYAVYLLARLQHPVGSYLERLQTAVQKNSEAPSFALLYMASSYHLMKDKALAFKALDACISSKQGEENEATFYSTTSFKIQTLEILLRWFPERFQALSEQKQAKLFETLIQSGTTFESAYRLLALEAYEKTVPSPSTFQATVEGITSTGNRIVLKGTGDFTQAFPIDQDLRKIIVQFHPSKEIPRFFYQMIESGFDQKLPTKNIKHGIEVFQKIVNSKGEPIQKVKMGDEIILDISIRSIDSKAHTDIAMTQLFPTGFEFVSQLDTGANGSLDFIDVREDRLQFYSFAETKVTNVKFSFRATQPGHIQVPPLFAQSMYEPEIRSFQPGETIIVEP